MNKVWILLVLSFAMNAEARRYKYYLNPRNAESILAGIALKGRISQSEWLSIIHNQKNATYTVVPGDNLWNISRKLFGDAWLWRKMWQVNQAILNPHEIDSGRVLAYYNENAEMGEWKIPVVKLTPDKAGNGNDLDNDKFINTNVKQRHRISNFVLGDEEILGEITGSYSRKKYFGLDSDLYLHFFDRSNVTVGDTYMIVHEEKVLRDLGDPARPIVGTLMTNVGEVKITLLGPDLVRAEILAMFHPMRRGDKIVRLERTLNWAAPMHPPHELVTRILIGEQPELKMYGSGSLVLLNKGTDEGMKPGYLFRVFRDTDPVKDRRDLVEPHYKGEVQVVYSGKLTSLGFITRSNEPIYLGDTLVPSQAIEEPLPPESRPNDAVEID